MTTRASDVLCPPVDVPATAAPVRAAVALAGIAGVAGMVTALVGNAADFRALYYVAVFAALAGGAMVMFTRKEPLRFAFFALIMCFPLAAAEVPPGRLALTVFHAVMAVLAVGLLAKKLSDRSPTQEPFFPTRAFVVAFALMLPCVALSQFPLASIQEFLFNNLSIYIFMLFALGEMKREGGFERIVLLLSLVLMVMAAGLYFDHLLHINLSLRGSNLNQSTKLESGQTVYRAGGFFQDPQTAGDYLACMITFLLLLAVRGRFKGRNLRYVVWAAIAMSLGALTTTVSRSAILACLGVSAIALFLFNKWHPVIKLLVLGGVIVGATSLAFTPRETLLGMLPATASERFLSSSDELAHRFEIWFDTWDMVADHPLTGIGPASFRPYLMATRPGIFNYYDIGTAEGVAYIPDQPESGYLKILYEGGILGSLAALTVIISVLGRGTAVMLRKTSSAAARTDVIAAMAALATFGATFVTLYTAADLRIAGICAIFLATILHRSLEREPAPQTASEEG